MPFGDDLAELPDADDLAARLAVSPSPFAWLPARLWTCPRCATCILSREAGPRCPRCSFREGT